jgi:hypothetical protein
MFLRIESDDVDYLGALVVYLLERDRRPLSMTGSAENGRYAITLRFGERAERGPVVQHMCVGQGDSE